MYRYRHRYAQSSCPKRDIQVKVWDFLFRVLPFGAISIILMVFVYRPGAGSGQMRDALFHPTQARRTEMRLITTLLFPRQDLRKRADHQKTSQKVRQMSLCCCACKAYVAIFCQLQFLRAMMMGTSCQTENGYVLFPLCFHYGSPVDS
jgi:hypothetical protein